MIPVTYIAPTNPLLKEHILHYYFMKSDDEVSPIRFVHFPHYISTLNIHQRAQVTFSKTKRSVKYDAQAPVTTLYTNSTKSFKEGHIFGAYHIVGINFTPLGFNHFISTRLDRLTLTNEVVVMDHLDEFKSTHMASLFDQKSCTGKGKWLDQFFLERFSRWHEPKLTAAVASLLKSNGTIKLEVLEKELCMSRRTLLRLFKRHLGSSIVDFKKVIKFRCAMDLYLSEKKDLNLTQLSYLADYYDQSDFINQFKDMAGGVPNKVLKNIDRVGAKDLFWQFK